MKINGITQLPRANVVLMRPLKGPLILILPFRDPMWANREWIKSALGLKTRPQWNKAERHWEISRTHFPILLKHLLIDFGPVDLYEDHSEFEICNASCQNATGIICTCRCMGLNHGIIDGTNEINPRKKWIFIDEDTEVLISVVGVKRLHYYIPPNAFRPLTDYTNQGYVQYQYGKLPTTYGPCPLCPIEYAHIWITSTENGVTTYDHGSQEKPKENVILVTDHCHEHGWIRGRICQRCNLRLHTYDLSFRNSIEKKIEIPDDIQEWLYKCPDCNYLKDGSKFIQDFDEIEI
jgi:hypothetical protein